MSTKTFKIIQAIIPDIHADSKLSPSQFIEKYWHLYRNNYDSNNSLNGNIFEELIAITLVRSNILPFYMQAKIAFIPNVNYDFVMYCKGLGPLVFSAKTSIRERYKQADLEAVALKYVHRKSESFVISLDAGEVKTRKDNLDDVMAIDNFIHAMTDEYDMLLRRLKQLTIITSPIISIVESNTIITSENYLARWDF